MDFFFGQGIHIVLLLELNVSLDLNDEYVSIIVSCHSIIQSYMFVTLAFKIVGALGLVGPFFCGFYSLKH